MIESREKKKKIIYLFIPLFDLREGEKMKGKRCGLTQKPPNEVKILKAYGGKNKIFQVIIVGPDSN